MNELRTMHLFAGHGGGLLADLILGHRPIVAVEWDRYACQVLRERAADGWFPGLHVWEGDVRLFDPSEYAGQVDCIHAGFPCQDISVAGKQAGVSEGTRSGLYREVLRIAGVVRPKQLFLENVSAILGNGLGTVLGDLATLGYDCRWLCIRASDVGAPHHRDRWFALCNAKHDGQFAAEKREGAAQRNDGDETWTQPASKLARSGDTNEKLVSDTNGENWGASGLGQNAGANGRDEPSGIGRFNTSVGGSNARPTPNAIDSRDRGNMSNPAIQRRAEIGKQLNLSMVVHPTSGKLSPDWVEWLMGFPIGFTVSKDWVTPKSHSKPQQHTDCLEDNKCSPST